MKKILLTLVILCVGVSMKAQIWTTGKIEGDELLGIKPCTAMVFQENNSDENSWKFVMFDNTSDDFFLDAPKLVFDFSGDGASGGKLVKGLVGFYDEDGKLIDKIENYCFETASSIFGQVHSNKYTKMGGNNKKNAKKILEYLQNKKGAIRFVLPVYGAEHFDLKVQCINN